MKTRTIVVLTILLIVLSVVYYFDSRSSVRQLGERVRQERLVGMPAAEIDTIGFRGPYGDVRLEKREDIWWMAAPMTAPADSKRLTETLLPLLEESRKYGAFASPTSDLSKFGFQAGGGLHVAVGNAASRKSEQFTLGVSTPLEGECYVLAGDGNMIYVTRTSVREQFEKPVVDYLDRRVPGFDGAQVRALRIERLSSRPGKAGVLAVRRSESGEWLLEEAAPGARVGMVCDREMVGALVGGLDGLRAADYVTSGVAASPVYGLDNPLLRIDVELADGRQTRKVSFVAGDMVFPPEKAAKLSPGATPDVAQFEQYLALSEGHLVFPAGRSLAAALEHEPADYRDRRLFALTPDEVCYLQVETRLGNVTQATSLVREAGGEWRLTEDPAAAVSQARVEVYVKFCLALRVETWTPSMPTSATLGLEEPAVRVTMRGPARESRQGVEVGALYDARQGLHYARRVSGKDEGSEVFGLQLPQSYMLMLQRTARYFRERRVFDVDLDSVSRVEILAGGERPTSVTLLRRKGGDSRWTGSLAGMPSRSVPDVVSDVFLQVVRGMEYQVPIDAASVTEQVRRLGGLEHPAVVFRFLDEAGQTLASLAIGVVPGREADAFMCVDHKNQYYYIQVDTLRNLSEALKGIVARLQ